MKWLFAAIAVLSPTTYGQQSTHHDLDVEFSLISVSFSAKEMFLQDKLAKPDVGLLPLHNFRMQKQKKKK